MWWVNFSVLLLPLPFFFFFLYCCLYHAEMNISHLWFWPCLGPLINQKLNTLLQSTWKFESHFNAAQETNECTEIKYVETKCFSWENQRHAVSLPQVFISYKNEIVICEVEFLFFSWHFITSVRASAGDSRLRWTVQFLGTVRVWGFINKAGSQLNSERSRFLHDSCTAVKHGRCQQKWMQPPRRSWLCDELLWWE